MKLSDRVLEELAKMVVGDAKHFPYRSSYYITRFFARCGLPFVHDGTTRPVWAEERLAELNLGAAQSADLPSDDLCRVISELFDSDDFDSYNEKLNSRGDEGPDHYANLPLALASFNKLVQRQGLIAYLDESGRCYLRSTGTGVSTATFSQQTRPLSPQEIEQRQKLAEFLDNASEDEFIGKVLVPLFQRLGFRRVSPTGHKDKSLEFGKDLFCFLSVREDVEVIQGWEKFRTNDFQEALDSGWSLPDLKIAIRASQTGTARKYYKRGASIVPNLELLVNNGQKLQERGLLATNPDGTSYPLPCGWDEDWVESLRLPSTPAQQACEKRRGHIWIDVLHTTPQCSACGKFRTNPVVTQWTAADDSEAECLDFIENYDPGDPYSSASEELTPTSVYRTLLSSGAIYRRT